MKVIVTPDSETTGKFTGMVRAFPDIWNGSVLDVGCRSRQLKDALPKETVDYLGVDLYPPVDVVGNSFNARRWLRRPKRHCESPHFSFPDPKKRWCGHLF
jgi:hypothetical protein